MLGKESSRIIRRILMVTLLLLLPALPALAAEVIPDGWDYELFADVEGIQDVSGPSTATCPVGAYGIAVDELGFVYLSTSSCNTGDYWIIRVEPDGREAAYRQEPRGAPGLLPWPG